MTKNVKTVTQIKEENKELIRIANKILKEHKNAFEVLANG